MKPLKQTLALHFAEQDGYEIEDSTDGVTLVIPAERLAVSLAMLHDTCNFSQLIDLFGIDCSRLGGHDSGRFSVVYHLLSLVDNCRLRLRTFCEDDDFPRLPSATAVWPSAGWYEREAFDLFGIVFDGHDDLRRILTDYGFAGHPFRKDFPLSGHVEMRYDPQQKRVIYQPVSIEPREVVPRIVRETTYGKER